MRALGELEERVMGILWRLDRPATVREVRTELNRDTRLAYTTVMTVMERLWRKGLLERRSQGRAFEYVPVSSEAEHTAELMHQVLSGTRDRRNALAHFVRGMKKSQEADLLRLAGEITRRKRGR